jgi:hypothetical protein
MMFLQPGFERFHAFFFPVPYKRFFLVELCFPANISERKDSKARDAEQLDVFHFHLYSPKNHSSPTTPLK